MVWCNWAMWLELQALVKVFFIQLAAAPPSHNLLKHKKLSSELGYVKIIHASCLLCTLLFKPQIPTSPKGLVNSWGDMPLIWQWISLHLGAKHKHRPHPPHKHTNAETGPHVRIKNTALQSKTPKINFVLVEKRCDLQKVCSKTAPQGRSSYKNNSKKDYAPTKKRNSLVLI